MITEAALIELLEKYENIPEAGEAAYMVSQGIKSTSITENLTHKYGSGQGYAQFKQDVAEMTGYDVDDSNAFCLVLDDEKRRLSMMTAPDVGAPLDERISHTFVETLAPNLQKQMLEDMSDISDVAQIFAGVARHGYEFGLWNEKKVRHKTVWDCCSLVNDHDLTDREKSKYTRELIESGCIYEKNRRIYITPMLAQLDNPEEHLPFLKPVWPDTKH